MLSGENKMILKNAWNDPFKLPYMHMHLHSFI